MRSAIAFAKPQGQQLSGRKTAVKKHRPIFTLRGEVFLGHVFDKIPPDLPLPPVFYVFSLCAPLLMGEAYIRSFSVGVDLTPAGPNPQR